MKNIYLLFLIFSSLAELLRIFYLSSLLLFYKFCKPKPNTDLAVELDDDDLKLLDRLEIRNRL